MSSVKVILLLIAIGMVGLVLFLGYKLDMYEERRKRKEKNIKKQNNNEIENDYTDFNPIRFDYKEKIEKTSTLDSTSFDLKQITSKSKKYSEEFDKTAVIEKIDLSKLEAADDDVISNNNVLKEVEVESDFEKIKEVEDDEIEENAYNYDDYDSSTMVFDTTAINASDTSEANDYMEDEIDFKSIKSEKIKQTKKSSNKKTSAKEDKTKTAPKSTARKTTKKVTKTAKTNIKK